jgi:hypothetical protein
LIGFYLEIKLINLHSVYAVKLREIEMKKILIGLVFIGTVLFPNSDLDKKEESVKKKLSAFVQSLSKEEKEVFPFYLKKYYPLIDKCSSIDLDKIKKLPLTENIKKDVDEVEKIYKNNAMLYLCLGNQYFNILFEKTKVEFSKEELLTPKILIDKKVNLIIDKE